MNVNDIDLSRPARVFLISNTPLFLLSKLQEDVNVLSLSQSVPGSEIFEALKEALRKEPQDLKDRVRPYVYLVALWLQSDPKFLEKTRELEPNYADDWFDFARQVLIQTYRPLARSMVSLAVVAVPPEISIASSAVNVIQHIQK